MGISLGLSSQPLIPVPGCVVVLSHAVWGQFKYFFFKKLLKKFWLRGPFAVVCGLSLDAMGGFSLVAALGFLSQSMGSKAYGLSS